MPILTRSKPRPSAIQCVREVRVGTAAEHAREVRRFYCDLLGLAPWPAEQQLPGTLGLGNAQCGLLLYRRHDPAVAPVRRRLTVTVHSLSELRQKLDDDGRPYELLHGLGWTDRCLLVRDPDGHLIEVRQSLPL